MKWHSQKVFLIILTVCVAFLDLSYIINLLNMGEIDFTKWEIFRLVLYHLVLAAEWGLYFWKKPEAHKETE